MDSLIILCLASYLIGSIPTGYLLAQTYGKQDLTKKGSKNIGTTNAYRIAGKKIGIATLLADFIKGIVPILLAQQIFLPEENNAMLLAGFFAVIGHIFPIWLGFKGGKGVATSVAVCSLINPILGLVAFSTFVLMFVFFRIVAIASLTAVFAVTITGICILPEESAFAVMVISSLIFWRHKENISRLLEGKEKKI